MKVTHLDLNDIIKQFDNIINNISVTKGKQKPKPPQHLNKVSNINTLIQKKNIHYEF